MIKKLFTSKLTSAASGECVIIGLKLTDAEAHALRFFGLVLFLVSLSVLAYEWHHKSTASEVTIAPAATTKRSRRNRRSRAPRTR